MSSNLLLHVANGTSTTRTIQAADIAGQCSIWADPLYDGPVPGGLNDRELLEVRRRHLTGSPSSAWGGPDPSLDPINDMREWRAAIERHDSYDELVLWFEHDLFDQLNLIQLLTWIREHLPEGKPVSLVCIGSYPGHPNFKGLGELTARELVPLFETRKPVTPSQFEIAGRAWQAFRASTPEPLEAFRHEDTSALPYLALAVNRFLQEYPWTADGLSRTERRLLELADGAGITLLQAFPRMHEGEDAYYVTDGTLAETGESLSRTSPPLLILDLLRPDQRHVLRGTVRLTQAGRSVVSGALDRVEACGIDRWLGGVHLQSGGPIWRWDDARQRITIEMRDR